MKFERYLETKRFIDAVASLRIMHHRPSAHALEYLERERIVVPRLRLRYPDAIERRWLNYERYGWLPRGRREPDGPRWEAACALEDAREVVPHRRKWNDPLDLAHPLDRPEPRWRPFIQYPARRRFVPWDEFRVLAAEQNGEPRYKADTVVTYYSVWQVLLFLECQQMGVRHVGNTQDWSWRDPIPDHWHRYENGEAVRAFRDFAKFQRQLDAVVWFAQEKAVNENYVLRNAGGGRRLIEEDESAEMERRTIEVLVRCRSRYRVSYPQMIELIQFLCRKWDHWDRIGYANHAKAYKQFMSEAIWLARYLRDVPVEKLFEDVGRVTGHFKPTLRVIYRDWATEWREDAERLLKGFASPNAILSADFNETEVNAFLDLVEERDLLDFYWRWKSLNERAFSGDLNRMAGLRSDLQGMALSVEHLVDVMLEGIVKHPKRQLYDKFKQLWPRDTDVGKLLKSPEYIGRARSERTIDLTWHEKKQEGDLAERIASDLAISHAICGSAHYSLSENNQLLVERMSVILLRGVMEAFRRSRSLDT